MAAQQNQLEAERAARLKATADSDKAMTVMQAQLATLMKMTIGKEGIPPDGGGTGAGADNP